jgi:hypothetical protein
VAAAGEPAADHFALQGVVVNQKNMHVRTCR